MRGNGRVYRPRGRAGIRCMTWWLDYTTNGRRHREPTGTTSKAEAQRLLRQKMTDREAGKVIGRPDRVTFAHLRDLAERQYTLDGRWFWPSAYVPRRTRGRSSCRKPRRSQRFADPSPTVNLVLLPGVGVDDDGLVRAPARLGDEGGNEVR